MFAAEYQNEPLVKEASTEALPTPAHIMDRVNRVPRGLVPPDATALTAFIDIQQDALFWTVCGWAQNFTGSVIDYGAWPDQQRRYFTLRDISQSGRTLSNSTPGQGLEAQIYAGLEALCGQLLDRDWLREDGTTARIERCLIDANWGRSTKVVKRFCRQSKWATTLTPSHGRYVGATSTPFDQFAKKDGEKIGEAWRMPKPTPGESRHIVWDTNYWKSFLFSRMTTGMGSDGAFTLSGAQPSEHRMLADHLLAENRVRVDAKGRTVDEWKIRPERPDNHLLDCLVGCAVAASMAGCSLASTEMATRVRRQVSIPKHLIRKATA
jgi:phage terminase large subunit GpA-like protein